MRCVGQETRSEGKPGRIPGGLRHFTRPARVAVGTHRPSLGQAAVWLSSSSSTPATGRVKLTVVPLPGLLSTQIRP